MFETYQRALNPRSILEVIGKDVLQSMMQGFFYKQQAGLTLLYDEQSPQTVPVVFKRIEPFDDVNLVHSSNFNPFCALFREDHGCNVKCEQCDAEHAALAMSHPNSTPTRYPCHMGLTDFAFPLYVDSRVRGVLFAGQLVPKDEPVNRERIRLQVRNKAPELEQRLMELADGVAVPTAEIEASEQRLKVFCQTLQKAIDALYAAEVDRAMQEAVVEASEHLSHSLAGAGTEDENGSVQDVIQGLQGLLHGIPVALLVRRRSRYSIVAASSAAISTLGRGLPVIDLVALQNGKWDSLVDKPEVRRKLASRAGFECPNGVVLRLDSSGPSELALSTIFLFGAAIQQKQRSFLEACCRAISTRVETLALLSALRRQQAEFVSQVAFSGHFLKTPIQSALFALRRLGRLGSTSEDQETRLGLLQRIEQQILVALFDAAVLQTANREMRTVFDTYPVILDLCNIFEPIGAGRGVAIAIPSKPDFSCAIRAIRSQFRVALSNLLDNAVKYSYAAKTVRIRLLQPERQQLLIEIENFGDGFSPADHDRLFHVGARAAASDSRIVKHGVGLGLSQSKQFLEEFGGSISIESESKGGELETGKGPHLTVVQVLLPIAS